MRLFFSFYLHDLDLSITCLQNAVCQISSSMTANVLTLSSTKTEFSLVGSHTTASQITRLLAEHQPFSSQSSFYFWWTCRSCHFLKANYGSVYVNPAVLFSWTSLYPTFYIHIKTPSTVANSIVHSKLSFCSHSTLIFQIITKINRIKLIQNSLPSYPYS